MNERRKAQRHRIYKAGTIEFSGTAIPCLIRNVSTAGATIEVNTPLWFPDRFTLGVSGDDKRSVCHIVWRREKRIGLAFE